MIQAQFDCSKVCYCSGKIGFVSDLQQNLEDVYYKYPTLRNNIIYEICLFILLYL